MTETSGGAGPGTLPSKSERRRRLKVLLLSIVPLLAGLFLVNHVDGRIVNPPDAGIYRGLATNLRVHGSLTTPSDQVWLRLSPAEVADRDGFVPVADFAPLYPALVAVSGSDGDGPFIRLHALALGAALLGLGAVVFRSTKSVVAGAGVQVFVLIGPTDSGPFGIAVTTMDLYAMVGADGLAVSFLLLALWAWPLSSPVQGWRPWVAGALLTAACLTRYAFLGAAAGLVAAQGLELLRARADRSRRDDAVRSIGIASAAVATTVAWTWLYELLTQGPPSKQFLIHLKDVSSIGRIMAGWVGLDIGTSEPLGYLAIGIVAVVGLAGFASRDRLRSIAGGCMVGYLTLHIATPLFLDRAFAFDSERVLFPVRVLLVIVIVSFAHDLFGPIRVAGIGGAPRSMRPVLLTVALGAIVVVLVSGPMLTDEQHLAGRRLLPLAWVDEPLLSNAPDAVYLATRQQVIDLPRNREPSTGEELSIPSLAAALVETLEQKGIEEIRVVVVPDFDPTGFARTEDWPTCVEVSPPDLRPTYQTYVLDLSSCGP